MSWAKAAVAVAIAALTVALSAADGGFTAQEYIQIALAALGALGVYLIPNSEPAVFDADETEAIPLIKG